MNFKISFQYSLKFKIFILVNFLKMIDDIDILLPKRLLFLLLLTLNNSNKIF